MNQFKTSDVITAACALFRINGNRIVRESDEGFKKEDRTSKQQLIDHLNGTVAVEITDADCKMYETAVQYIQQKILMNTVSGKETSEFITDINNLTYKETLTNRQLGQALWMPKVYKIGRAHV